MNILALDTSGDVLSVALTAQAENFYTEIDAGRRHSELLMECVDGLFKTADLRPKELELVTCMKGPGSFTGLRIGFSAAKGLCLALGIPLVTAPTLDCLAKHLSKWPGIVVSAMDAKKGCFFTAFYRGGERLTDYMDVPPEALAGEADKLRKFPNELLILTGSGAELLKNCLSEYIPMDYCAVDAQSRKGRAMELISLAKTSMMNVNEINSGPLYLRKSDAELNSNTR